MGLINRPTATRRGPDIPSPGGENAQQASSVYHDFYGELPVPATAYVTSTARLQSLETVPSVLSDAHTAPIVNRRNSLQGMRSTGGIQAMQEPTSAPSMVRSSQFQDWLIGPHVNYVQNDAWYIAYPAATVMFGGMHNLAYSERVPQIPTRTSGGPGAPTMMRAPRFKAVQTVPRYSTMPPTYPTTS